MTRKTTQIIVLGAVLLALGALATWDEWQTEKDEKAKETKGLLVTDVKPDDVVAINYFSRGDSETGGDKSTPAANEPAKSESKAVSLTMVRKDGRWIISSPVTGEADPQTVSDLLKNILEYKSENAVAEGKDKWSTFGIEPPRRKIELETSTGRKLTFLVGNNTPVGFNAYVATNNSEKVFSGSQYIATATSKSLFEFRDKRVLSSLATPEVSSIFISKAKDSLKLEKINNAWEMTSPSKSKADTVAVNNLLDDLSSLRALEIIDQPDAALRSLTGKSPPIGEIQIQIPGSKLSLRLFEKKDEIFASVSGQSVVFKVNQDAKNKILKNASDLRDKKIFYFQSSDIANVTVDGQSFKKVANDWYSEADAAKFSPDGKFNGKAEEKPSAASHVRGLVVDLEYARAEDVMENSTKLKLSAAPKHQVTLTSSSGSQKININAWLGTGTDAEMIWLKISDSDKVYKVKKSVLASVTPQASKPAVGDEMTMPPSDVSN